MMIGLMATMMGIKEWRPDSSYGWKFKNRMKWTARAVRFWASKDGAPILGTPKPDESWPYGSRQVRRAAMRAMNFRLIRMKIGLGLPRRECREAAREATVKQWRHVTSQAKRFPSKHVGFWDAVGIRLRGLFSNAGGGA